MASDSDVVLELVNVGRAFGTGETRTESLKAVSLTVRRGEFVAIVGPSGAGKSTLLNILGLLDRASEGIYRLDGVDVATLSEAERDHARNASLGFVFQDSHMMLSESAIANVALPLKIRGTRIAERAFSAADALELVGLSHRRDARAVNLSGGERQRVALARAIVTEPTLLLADEPTGALDSINSSRIIEHLQQLNRDGMTVIVITHDETVAQAAGRTLRLVDGSLVDRSEYEPAFARSTTTTAATVPGQQRLRKPSRVAEEFTDALSTHTRTPGRALLLLVAFALAIAGLVTSIGVGESGSAQIAERLTQASLDEVVVRAADPAAYQNGFYFPRPDGEQMTGAESLRPLDGVVDVGAAATFLNVSARVRLLPDPRQAQGFTGTILAADPSYLAIQSARVEPASAVGLLANAWGAPVAVIGAKAAAELGIASVGPGVQIWVGNQPVDVVGILHSAARDATLESAVILSPDAVQALVPEDARLVIRTEQGYPASVAEAVPLALTPADPQAVRVDTVADLRNLSVGVSSDLGVLVGAVSILLLVLAGLTSSVSMYLSVQSRAKEIALRRALGSSRGSIWRLFTFEGLTVGMAGGLAGGSLGLCAVVVVSAINGWTPTIDARTFIVGTVIGAVSGVASATYPALVAARADPALAIRA